MPKGAIFMDRGGEQGALEFEVTDLSASGGPDFPLLRIRTGISLYAYLDHSKQPVSVRPLSLIRIKGQLSSPDHRVIARFQEDVTLHATNPHTPNSTQTSFEVPLELSTVSKVERERGSADLRLRLTCQPLFGLHSQNGSMLFLGGRVEVAFFVPRSQWTDSLLPGLGYGGLELLEVRYGPGVIAQQLPKSVEQIQEGKRCLLNGEWEKCAVHCRKSIEAILDSRPTSTPVSAKFRDRVSSFINDNLKLDDAEAKLLSGQMQLIWEVTSPAAHPAAPHRFVRADSEFVLRQAMALVEYFSRLLA